MIEELNISETDKVRYRNILLFNFALVCLLQGGREIIGLAVYHLVSILLFLRMFKKVKIKEITIHKPLLFFLTICFCSAILSTFLRMRGLIHFTTILIHCLNFYLLTFLKDEKFFKKFFVFLILICGAFSLSLLIQSFLNKPLTLLFPNVNLLAIFIDCGIIANFCFILREKSETVQSNIFILKKAVPWISLLLMISAETQLFSIGGFISLIAGFAALLILSWKKVVMPLCYLFVFLLALISISSTTPQVLASKLVNVPYNTRLVIWKSSVLSFLQKPILGWGLGSFGQVYQINKLPIESDIGRYEKTTRFAHNEYFDIAVEMGSLGLIAFLWLLFSIIKKGFKSMLLRKNESWIFSASFSSIVMLAVHIFFDFSFHLPILVFLFLLFTSVFSNMEDGGCFSLPVPNLILKPILWIWCSISLVTILFSLNLGIAQMRTMRKDAPESNFHTKITAFMNLVNGEKIQQFLSLQNDKKKEMFLPWAAKINPGDDILHTSLARIYTSKHQYDQALSSYLNAVKHSPKNPFIHSELGDFFLMNGKLDSAFSAYSKAIQLEPFYIFAHCQLGEIYAAKGKKMEALNSFQRALSIKELNLIPNSDYEKRLLEFDPKFIQISISKLKK